MLHRYETDGAAIYRKSFAIIRAEADLAPFSGTSDKPTATTGPWAEHAVYQAFCAAAQEPTGSRSSSPTG